MADTPAIIGGRYRLLSKLGEGGFGAVYRAENLATGGDVAVKLLRGDHASVPGQVERFTAEARRTARLSHPNTIRVFDSGTAEDGSLFMAMELLRGQSLAEALSKGPLDPAEAVVIAEQILSALVEAHSLGIVHRDLKPENVFLVGDGRAVKLLDFGIAKVLEGSVALTQSGAVLGTPAYMAPEQCRGEPIDARADLYALGCVMHHALAGQPPFSSDNTLGFLLAHVQTPPPALPPHVPAPLRAWVARALAKAREDRFASAAEALAALRPNALPAPTLAPPRPPAHARDPIAAATPRRRWRWLLLLVPAVAIPVTIVATRPPEPNPLAVDVAQSLEAYRGYMVRAKTQHARLSAQAIRVAAQQYRTEHAGWPSGVDELVEKRMIERPSDDPWGNPFVFELKDGEPRVCSRGPDGKVSNDDVCLNADL